MIFPYGNHAGHATVEPMSESNEEKLYKSSAFAHELQSDLSVHMDKFKDPLVLGELVYKLLEERENTNRILKNLLAKFEALETRLVGVDATPTEPLLAEVDEEILRFVRSKGKATAEDVRAHFNYKGTNAASARLNRLFDRNILVKHQAGRKTYFLPVQ